MAQNSKRTKETKTQEPPVVETKPVENKDKEILVDALVLETHTCEIIGKRLNLKKGEKVKLTPFQFQVLSNSNLLKKIVQAI